MGDLSWLKSGFHVVNHGKSKNKKPNWGCSVLRQIGLCCVKSFSIRVIRRPASTSLPQQDVEWSMSWEAWQLINVWHFCSTTSDVSNAMILDALNMFFIALMSPSVHRKEVSLWNALNAGFKAHWGLTLPDLAHWTHQVIKGKTPRNLALVNDLKVSWHGSSGPVWSRKTTACARVNVLIESTYAISESGHVTSTHCWWEKYTMSLSKCNVHKLCLRDWSVYSDWNLLLNSWAMPTTAASSLRLQSCNMLQESRHFLSDYYPSLRGP